jgi:hypothetical protein
MNPIAERIQKISYQLRLLTPDMKDKVIDRALYLDVDGETRRLLADAFHGYFPAIEDPPAEKICGLLEECIAGAIEMNGGCRQVRIWSCTNNRYQAHCDCCPKISPRVGSPYVPEWSKPL